jgi:hypothetical protein
MDVQAINAATEKELGYPMFDYWYFFTEEGTSKLLGDHVSCNVFLRNLRSSVPRCMCEESAVTLFISEFLKHLLELSIKVVRLTKNPVGVVLRRRIFNGRRDLENFLSVPWSIKEIHLF